MDRVADDTGVADFALVVTRAAESGLPLPASACRWRNGSGVAREIIAAPGIRILVAGRVQCEIAERGGVAIVRPPQLAAGGEVQDKIAREALRCFIDGAAPPAWLRGRYVLVAWDAATRKVRVASDAFRTCAVHYYATAEDFACATDLGLLLAAADIPRKSDPAAIYHYLNFAFVPSPFSPVRGVAKLPPDHVLEWPPLRVTGQGVCPRYTEDLDAPQPSRVQALRDRMIATVCDYRPGPAARWGTYLSGGTDSSSIAGILARFGERPNLDSYSIGFAESEFDESRYARLAAQTYGLRYHVRSVNEADALQAIPVLARGFDEPFGNPSAIGSFYCARLAHATGKRLLIAGDGGDEIFGGNERYAKDQVFRWYQRAPAVFHHLGRGLSAALAPLDNVHLANRLRKMEARGRVPNPDRFYADTSFASDYFDSLLEPGFRKAVERDSSLEFIRSLYRLPERGGDLNRMLYVDLRLTIADSDLVKVIRSARLADIDVAFPYLDRPLVEFTGRLRERDKVRGLAKRWLFKKAMNGILPQEILRKKKQGFGVPVSLWLRRDGPMRALVRDTVLSPRALGRGYVQPRFVRQLIARHEKGVWDHSSEIYRLLMLELWHRQYVDERP